MCHFAHFNSTFDSSVDDHSGLVGLEMFVFCLASASDEAACAEAPLAAFDADIDSLFALLICLYIGNRFSLCHEMLNLCSTTLFIE